jgi:hypothetical protein
LSDEVEDGEDAGVIVMGGVIGGVDVGDGVLYPK